MPDLRVNQVLEGYAPEVGAALWRLEDARERTLELLSEMPPAYVDAEVRGNRIGTILYHLALVEADWLFVEVLGQEEVPEELNGLFPEAMRDEAGQLTLIRQETPDQHLARLHAMRQILLENFRGMTDEAFHRPRELPQYDVSPAWVLHHLAQHEAEHRGELGWIINFLRDQGRPEGETR
jgi:uncharacterized damage-inducible protein DinB